MFVLTVATNEFVRDTILVPNVGPLPQTQQLKQLKTLMPQKNQQNQQNSQKLLRQLEVVPCSAAEGQNNPDGYQVAAFVPSKVPWWRKPPFLKILIPKHHITPHMIKVNVMAKLNTVPDSALNEIEEFLDI